MPADLDEDRFGAANQGLDTLTEVIQGPCAAAQAALMDGKVLVVCSQIMADPFTGTPLTIRSLFAQYSVPDAFPDADGLSDEPDPLIMDAKEKSVFLLLSLMEGVTDKVLIIHSLSTHSLSTHYLLRRLLFITLARVWTSPYSRLEWVTCTDCV